MLLKLSIFQWLKKGPIFLDENVISKRRLIILQWGNFNLETEWTFKWTGQRKRLSRDQKVCYCLADKSYPTLCDPKDCSPPGSSVHETLRQENWSGLPFPSPGDLPNPGIEPTSPALAGRFFTSEPPGKPGTGGQLEVNGTAEAKMLRISNPFLLIFQALTQVSPSLGGLICTHNNA